jgi:hypothetical protein
VSVSQCPAPLQKRPSTEPPKHTLGPHTVPFGQYGWHPPLPLHCPLAPHVVAACIGQGSPCGFISAIAGKHVPSVGAPASPPGCWSFAAHAMHVALHGPSQQKPSTHATAHCRQPTTLQSATGSHALACGFCG